MGVKAKETPGNPASYRGLRAVVRHPSVHKYAGRPLDNGQVFRLQGAPNDDRIVRLGLVELIPAEAEIASCPVCGASFAAFKNGPNAQRSRDRHCRRTHEASDSRPVIRDAQASDLRLFGEETRFDEKDKLRIGNEPDNDPGAGATAPPIYFDQSAASRGVKADTPIQVSTI